MSDIQKELFDNDLDPVHYEVDDLDIVKEAYMVLGKCDENQRNARDGYQAAFNNFQASYDFLSSSDKRKFERWKEENGYNW